MDRKKLFFGLGVASGGAAVVGSGAFSSMQAERGVSVEVVGDDAAYLALEPAEGPNGQYASINENGLLEVQVSDENEAITGEGVNPDSWYDLGNVFQITNQGTQQVGIWVEHDSERVSFLTGETALDDPEAPVFADSGESLPVRISVDTRDVESDVESLLDEISIHANADPDEETSDPSVSAVRSVGNPKLEPGESTEVTITVELDSTSDVDVFERFSPVLGTAAFEEANGESGTVSPSFVELDDGGGIVLFDSVESGELSIEYSITVSGDAQASIVPFEPNQIEIDKHPVPVSGVDEIEVTG